MKLYEWAFWVCPAIKLILTLSGVENHCSAKILQNFPILSSLLLTKQDSNSLHFSLFYFSPFWWRTITHNVANSKKGFGMRPCDIQWREAFVIAHIIQVVWQPIWIFQLLTNSCRPGLSKLAGSLYKPKNQKIAMFLWAMCAHQALLGTDSLPGSPANIKGLR